MRVSLVVHYRAPNRKRIPVGCWVQAIMFVKLCHERQKLYCIWNQIRQKSSPFLISKHTFEIAMGLMLTSVLLASQLHKHFVVFHYMEEDNCLSYLRFCVDFNFTLV